MCVPYLRAAEGIKWQGRLKGGRQATGNGDAMIIAFKMRFLIVACFYKTDVWSARHNIQVWGLWTPAPPQSSLCKFGCRSMRSVLYAVLYDLNRFNMIVKKWSEMFCGWFAQVYDELRYTVGLSDEDHLVVDGVSSYSWVWWKIEIFGKAAQFF